MFERPRATERAVLVRLGLGAAVRPEDLEEFEQLARSAGAEPVATITGRRERPDSRFFVGTGKADEIANAAGTLQAELILVDHPLSPSQQRNLEHLSGVRVLDRSGLILDIFAQRARSFEGKLEVELAQLKRLSTSAVRSGEASRGLRSHVKEPEKNNKRQSRHERRFDEAHPGCLIPSPSVRPQPCGSVAGVI
jgi:GTP-binding protein HflX